MISICKGDIFYTMWGYDQTNTDLIIVDSISKTGKTAICKRCKATTADIPDSQQIGIEPIREGYGETFRMRIEERKGKTQLRGSYLLCPEYKRLDTFWKWEGEKLSETHPMFGH